MLRTNATLTPAIATLTDPARPRAVVLTPLILENFINGFLREDLDGYQPTPDFHREAWGLVCDHSLIHVALAAPRGHAKSTGITFAYVLAALLFRVTDFPVIISNTHKKAIEFVRNIKTTLLDNERIRQTFKFRRLIKDSEDDFIAEFDDGHQCRVISAGFGMSVRGFNWGTRRPDMLVGDDMEDDEQVMSPDRREKAQTWFLSALLPMLSKHGVVRVVGTIMHSDSLLQSLLDDEDTWVSRVWEAHDDNFEHILWPAMFSADKLRAIQRQFAKQGKLDKYAMEYRNRAFDASSGLFRDDDFLKMVDADFIQVDQHPEWQRVIGGDFAISTRNKRDYTAFVVGVVGPDYLYIVDLVKRRMDGEEIVRTMFEIEMAHRLKTSNAPLQWWIEDGAIRKALGYSLELEQRRKGVFLNMCPMNPGTTDKRTRSMAIRARCRAKAVKFDTDASWWPDFRQECLEFDKGKHDDVVDALAYIGIGLSQGATPPNEDELDEEEYFRQKEQTMPSLGGRSPVTGY